jgi:hypothetical protein
MKKLLIIAPLVALLGACGTTSDRFEKRAEAERDRQERLAERALNKAPKWMVDLPKSNSAIYQNGSAVSYDMGMSVNKAKTMAYGKICMSAGGRVDQQTKIYRLDSDRASTEHSELAIRSFCPGVDISGVEMVETKMISEGGQFRTYVLVALPTGDANAIQKFRAEQQQRRLAETRSREAFKEMDQTKPAQ